MRWLLRALFNLLRIAFAPLWWVAHRLRRPRGNWVYLRVHAKLVEMAEELPWWRRLGQASSRLRTTDLLDVRKLFDQLASDSSLQGCVLEMRHLHAGWSTCLALRTAMLSLRSRGKRICVYLPWGGSNRELMVALAADRVLVSPEASFMLLGLAARATYWTGLLERVGLHVEAHAQGSFKTAAERWTRTSMSDAEREQLTALLSVLQGELARSLGFRGLDPSAAERAFEQGMFRSEEAQRAGLADGLCYPDELASALGGDSGSPARWIPAGHYLRWTRSRLWLPLGAPRYVAVVPIRGAIGLDDAPALPAGGVAGVIARLRAARKDPKAMGVVLHIDSPGGSALGSDLIHREVTRLAAEKPVVAFLGEVAASGGYYIAAGAHRIVAQATTITGSIGVITARLVAKGLIERLQLHVETLRMAPHADLFAPNRSSTEEERALLERHAAATYRRFVQVVAEGRGLSEARVDALGQGRVWSGLDAERQGLVDRLGGFDTALDEVRARLRHLPGHIRASLEPRVLKPPKHGPQLPPAPGPGPAAAAVQWAAELAAGTVATGGMGAGELEQALAILTQREPVLYMTVHPWCLST